VVQEQVLERRQGGHMCLEYASNQELGAIVGDFVGDGLRAGEKVGYVTGSDVATVTRWLDAEGVAWEPALGSAALVLIAQADLKADGDGSRVTALAARVRAFVEDGLSEGYRALRMASEVRALAPAGESVEQMRAREALADELTAAHPVTGLCLYDQRRFDREFLAAAARAHGGRATADVLCADDIVTITRQPGRPGLCIAGEIDGTNAAALRQTLAGMAGDCPDGVTLDLDELRFIDVAGLRAIVETATAWPQTPWLMVHASPVLARLFGVCGWDRLPNLPISPGGGRR
jgi:anti-anti-sigma factor